MMRINAIGRGYSTTNISNTHKNINTNKATNPSFGWDDDDYPDDSILNSNLGLCLWGILGASVIGGCMYGCHKKIEKEEARQAEMQFFVNNFNGRVNSGFIQDVDDLKFEAVTDDNLQAQIQKTQQGLKTSIGANLRQVFSGINNENLTDEIRKLMLSENIQDNLNALRALTKGADDKTLKSIEKLFALAKEIEILELFSKSEDLQAIYSEQAKGVAQSDMGEFLGKVLFVTNVRALTNRADERFAAFKENPLYTENSNQQVREQIIAEMPQTRDSAITAFARLTAINLSEINKNNLTNPTNASEKAFAETLAQVLSYPNQVDDINNSYERYYALVQNFDNNSAKLRESMTGVVKLKDKVQMKFSFGELRKLVRTAKELENQQNQVVVSRADFSKLSPLSVRPDFYTSGRQIAESEDEIFLRDICQMQQNSRETFNSIVGMIDQGAKNYQASINAAVRKGQEEADSGVGAFIGGLIVGKFIF